MSQETSGVNDNSEAPLLELETMVGFGGGVPAGLRVHPDGEHLVYPVGCTVVVESLSNGRQRFLSGHTNSVSCLAISPSGKYIASGQITHMGYKADVILWDFAKFQMVAKFSLHKVKVEALAFSPNEKYLVTLGGEDDGSVVVWCLQKKEAVCGSPAQTMSAGITQTIAYSNSDDNMFITAGSGTLRIWQLDRPNRKIRPTEVNMGQLKRVVRCIQISPDDNYAYCGTTTGDIFSVNIKSSNMQVRGPEKDPFGMGVTSIALLKSGEVLTGAGDGTVCIVKSMENNFKRSQKTYECKGAVTSIAVRGAGHQFFVGTDLGNVYRFNATDFKSELIKTCHNAPINDITFPYQCSELLITSSYQDIRIWSMSKGQEVMRIHVPNMTCNCVEVMRDGKSIISGWDDGRIRAFYPESGRPMYSIEHAHLLPVTAIATAASCREIVSGGKDGVIRVWTIENKYGSRGDVITTKLRCSLKEHKASVTCIKMRNDDTECVTSSDDGSCIIWDLVHEHRRQMIRVNTLFKYVLYHPDNFQILTCGTDRKVGYWETYDGSMIRELEGSKSGSINALGISSKGTAFVSGGDDKLVKVWTYDEGEIRQVGIGHSAQITRVAISPDESFIISVSRDGAIIRWKFPLEAIYDNSQANAVQEPSYYYYADTSRSQEQACNGCNGQQADVMRLDTDRSAGYRGDAEYAAGNKSQTPTGRQTLSPGATGRTANTHTGSGHGHAAVM